MESNLEVLRKNSSDIKDIVSYQGDALNLSRFEDARFDVTLLFGPMMTLIAFFMKDEFPEVDMEKVIKMCIIHDLGEAFTGDIPTFEKTESNEATEEELLYSWVKSLPENYAKEMLNLYDEMAKRETAEAKVYKAIDSLEALIQHNISDLSTWIPKEYELNKTYADDKVAFSEYLKELREEIRKDTLEKLGE